MTTQYADPSSTLAVFALNAAQTDIYNSLTAAAGVDLGKAQGYINNISPDHSDEASDLQNQYDQLASLVGNVPPEDTAANQAAFAQTSAHLTQDASTLDSDPLYTRTEGAMTSSSAAAAANADSGASNNYFNVDQDVAAAHYEAQPVIDELHKIVNDLPPIPWPPKIPSVNALLGTTALAALAVLGVSVVVLVVWFRIGR